MLHVVENWCKWSGYCQKNSRIGIQFTWGLVDGQKTELYSESSSVFKNRTLSMVRGNTNACGTKKQMANKALVAQNVINNENEWACAYEKFAIKFQLFAGTHTQHSRRPKDYRVA